MAGELPLTGERTVPGVASENYWFRRHEAGYRFAASLASPPRRVVLDVGCGEGYGAAGMLGPDRRVIALDYDELSIRHAGTRYPGLTPLRANLAALPIADSAVDVLVCLQVIEHVWDHRQFLDECRRVLAPDGVLVMSTPNRLTFSPGSNRPLNPFHSHEFVADELQVLLRRSGLPPRAALGLHAGPRLVALDRTYAEHGGFTGAQLAGAPEAWDARLTADVAAVQVSDFVLSGERLDTSLDLFVVATR